MDPPLLLLLFYIDPYVQGLKKYLASWERRFQRAAFLANP